MIFVTLGTHEAPMNRVSKALDELPDELRQDIVYQFGYSESSKVGRAQDFFAYDDMARFFASCSVLICHGGPGSIIPGLRRNLRPIVIPRDPVLGEHVDDHQIKFTSWLEEQGLIIKLNSVTNLRNVVLDSLQDFVQVKQAIASDANPRFVKKLQDKLGSWNLR